MAVMDVIQFKPAVTDWILFKSPITNFNKNSRLVVGPGQVAIFVYGGKIEGEYESGTHILNSANLPVVGKLASSLYGGEAVYQAEVYFFNKIVKLDWLWGIKDGIRIKDPIFNVIIQIQARGQMGLRLVNKQFFLTQIYGAFSTNIVPYSKTQDYFRGIINTKIKPIIMSYISQNKVSTLELALVYEEVAALAKDKLKDEFSTFGFELVNLSIETLEPRAEDLVKVNELLHKRAEFDIVGSDNYRTARSFDVLETAAGNEGEGSLVGAGMGIGMGIGAGKVASQLFGNIADQATTPKEIVKIICPSCASHVALDSKFCPECGHKFSRSCSKCNSDVPPGSKFCPNCGEKL
jgi:membrane protease subunit (stomatin/prohibitin family)